MKTLGGFHLGLCHILTSNGDLFSGNLLFCSAVHEQVKSAGSRDHIVNSNISFMRMNAVLGVVAYIMQLVVQTRFRALCT